MKELVFLLEEESAKAMLQGIVPRLLPADCGVRYVVFEGKQDLERQLVRKLRSYLNPDARFLVLRDQDAHPNCVALKAKLASVCAESGRLGVLVRLACRELESFYLADLAAVETGLDLRGLAGLQGKTKFRAPDYLAAPSHELLRLTKGQYQKVSGSRAIGPHLDLGNRRSASFACLVGGICRLAAQ